MWLNPVQPMGSTSCNRSRPLFGRTGATMEPIDKERTRYISALMGEAQSFDRESCIVESCDNEPINSHLIPKSWISLIAREGHVINMSRWLRPSIKTTLEEQLFDELFLTISRPLGINKATSHGLFCWQHDSAELGVGLIDDRDSGLNSNVEQHLLFYKAICFSLYESELVLSMKKWIMTQRPRTQIERDIYFLKEQGVAHRSLLSQFQQCLEGKCDFGCTLGLRMEFKRLFVRGDGIPTVSALGCGSGLIDCGIEFECNLSGCKFPQSDSMIACKPAKGGHVIVMARTRRDHLKSGYCKYLKQHHKQLSLTRIFDENPPQGTQLELFVSQELIEASNGFLCSPERWEEYGPRMRDIVKHHFVQQPSHLGNERRARFPTEVNRRFNLFRSI